MSDVERITTTEQLRREVAEAIARADGLGTDGQPGTYADDWLPEADAAIAVVTARVVEGLVTTIKALPVYWVHPALTGFAGAYRERTLEDFKAAVLAVVEAAREDTT